jgi:hypothetical protein
MTTLLTLLLLAAAPQPAAAPATFTPEQRALALELVQLVQPELSYRSGLEQMTEQMLPSLEAQAASNGKPLPPDFRKRFNAALLEVVPYQEVMGWSAELYAQRFSASELKQLIAFYKTPLGRKISLMLPEFMGEVGKKISVLMPQRLPAALKRHGLLQDSAPPPAQK